MGFSAENISERLKTMPMVAALVPLAAGIAFSCRVEADAWVWCTAAAVSVLSAVLLGRFAALSVAAALFSLGALLYGVNTPPEVPYGERMHMTFRLVENPAASAEHPRASAVVESCAENGSVEGVGVVLFGDALEGCSSGDEISAVAAIRPFYEGSYASLMYHRGHVGTVYLYPSSLCGVKPSSHRTLHMRCADRIRGLMPEGGGRAVVLSMSAGDRSEITPALRRSYSLSGASHLLAVSGLHVGIVFLLVNVLLWAVPLARYGNIIKGAAAVAAIWLYASVCSFSPSVVRAAVMFSALQLSLGLSREYASANILAATAFVMLVTDPHVLFDISFQLSFIAVAGIIFWGVPLYRLVRTRHRLPNAVSGTVVVGAVATAVTMPLISYVFGTVSFIGILLNPLVILTAYLVVLLSVAALLLPAAPAVWLLKGAGFAAEVQNAVVGAAASAGWGHADVRIPAVAVAAAYMVFAAATVVSWGFVRRGDVYSVK